jgi:hypothetical protein
MAFVKDANGISFKNRLKGHINWRKVRNFIIISQGVIPHPLPEVNFIMVEIPTSKPYIFMIRVNRQIKCLKS